MKTSSAAFFALQVFIYCFLVAVAISSILKQPYDPVVRILGDSLDYRVVVAVFMSVCALVRIHRSGWEDWAE
jgi:hypothetical protein